MSKKQKQRVWNVLQEEEQQHKSEIRNRLSFSLCLFMEPFFSLWFGMLFSLQSETQDENECFL